MNTFRIGIDCAIATETKKEEHKQKSETKSFCRWKNPATFSGERKKKNMTGILVELPYPKQSVCNSREYLTHVRWLLRIGVTHQNSQKKSRDSAHINISCNASTTAEPPRSLFSFPASPPSVILV